jgi:hypothetical protein
LAVTTGLQGMHRLCPYTTSAWQHRDIKFEHHNCVQLEIQLGGLSSYFGFSYHVLPDMVYFVSSIPWHLFALFKRPVES